MARDGQQKLTRIRKRANVGSNQLVDKSHKRQWFNAAVIGKQAHLGSSHFFHDEGTLCEVDKRYWRMHS
jgi:hypothetical protein